jgi:transmembrane sensor
MSNSRLIELITRKMSGEASAEELQEMEAILSANPDAYDRYKVLSQFWEQHDNTNQPVVEEALGKVLQELELPAATPVVEMDTVKPRSYSHTSWRRISIAATIILVAGIVLFNRMIRTGDRSDSLLVEKQNSKGVKSTIELTDGSKIWLNADSKVQYPKVFTGNTREIYLNGEAFFEVAKDASKPFIIHLSNGTVRVLGTSFNIRAYDNEKIVETSVSTGRVAFIPKYRQGDKKQDTVFLTPDNKARYLFTREELVTEPTISKEDKAWTEGKLIFKAMTLEDIAVQLERNFGTKVVFVSDAPRQYTLTGSFQNNSLEEIMYYLKKSKEFNYKITNTELLIGLNTDTLPD